MYINTNKWCLEISVKTDLYISTFYLLKRLLDSRHNPLSLATWFHHIKSYRVHLVHIVKEWNWSYNLNNDTYTSNGDWERIRQLSRTENMNNVYLKHGTSMQRQSDKELKRTEVFDMNSQSKYCYVRNNNLSDTATYMCLSQNRTCHSNQCHIMWSFLCAWGE